MPLHRHRIHRHEGAHRLLFPSLITVLAGFSLWSVWLLVHSQGLRRELDLYFGWLDEVQSMRGALERFRAEAGNDPADREAFDRFRRETEEWLRRSRDPALGVAFQNLRLALEELSTEGASADALWQASVAALSAIDTLEREIRGHVTGLHEKLGRHWRSLWLLIPGTLMLAGSNSLLLWVVHRRRRELETAHSEVLASARHDPLTGLWNREGILRLLDHELHRAGRSRKSLGVILTDLENFQAVNELVGYDQGDSILVEVARRLESLVRPYDTMGRVGGDSFLIVLPSCDASATKRVSERLVEAVNGRGVEHAFGRIQVTLNLAHETVDGADGADVDTLLRQLQEGIEGSKTSIPRPGRL